MVFKKGDPNIYRRPKKTHLVIDDPVSESISTSTVATIAVKPAGGFDLVLGIRRIRDGNFSGLWELSELSLNDANVHVKRIMTDANIKPILIAQIGRALNACF